MKQVVLSILVDNTGVLSRVSGLFSRRGYNISLTAGETQDLVFLELLLLLRVIIKLLTRLSNSKA